MGTRMILDFLTLLCSAWEETAASSVFWTSAPVLLHHCPESTQLCWGKDRFGGPTQKSDTTPNHPNLIMH